MLSLSSSGVGSFQPSVAMSSQGTEQTTRNAPPPDVPKDAAPAKASSQTPIKTPESVDKAIQDLVDKVLQKLLTAPPASNTRSHRVESNAFDNIQASVYA
ncbi:hypothetical protein ACQZV8_09025 [Magnetococcales bacterium HHB-1]